MSQYKLYILFFLFSSIKLFSQIDSTFSITFDFNDQEIKEKDHKVTPKGVGVSLVSDRFGNEKSALHTHGHSSSYLTLGTSSLLKSPNMSISLWVNFDRRVYSGKGYDCNPVLGIKNGPGDDFTNAYAIAYECYSGRLGINSTKDSTKEVSIYSSYPLKFNKWYHIVYICNNDYLALYIDGKLEGKSYKRFETKFLNTDSITVGHSASIKNERYSEAIFDDIQFFHKSLSDKEVLDLYHASNPNKIKQLLIDVAKYIGIILIFVIIIIILVIRNKRNLKKQKEQFELYNRINELEIKVIKNQMNPHFISNCLAAIQELIYTKNYKKATQYIAKFSFFLRQVLQYSDKTYITLQEELTIIKLNIELEQLRFKEEFDFKLNVQEHIDLNNILIPSLITQPFIENAIWHGLLPLESKRKACLSITIVEKNDTVYLEIEDNGVGRSFNNHFKKHDSKGTKLAMDKIESLNKLLRGNDYKLEIVDLFDGDNNPLGTKIIIQLKNSKE